MDEETPAASAAAVSSVQGRMFHSDNEQNEETSTWEMKRRESDKIYHLCKGEATLDTLKLRISLLPWFKLELKHVLGIIRSTRRLETNKVLILQHFIKNYPLPSPVRMRDYDKDDGNNEFPMFLSCQLNQLLVLQLLSNQQLDGGFLNRNHEFDTLLHVSCRSNSIPIIDFLIEKSPQLIGMRNREGVLPFDLSIGNLQVQSKLFSSFYKVSIVNSPRTLLDVNYKNSNRIECLDKSHDNQVISQVVTNKIRRACLFLDESDNSFDLSSLLSKFTRIAQVNLWSSHLPLIPTASQFQLNGFEPMWRWKIKPTSSTTTTFTWQDDFYLSRVGFKFGFQDKVMNELIPTLRAFQPEIILVNFTQQDCKIIARGEEYYLFIGRELTKLAEMCCEGRLITFIDKSSTLPLHAIRSYLNCLCALQSNQEEDEEREELESQFYIQDKSLSGQSQIKATTSSRQHTSTREPPQLLKSRKRKANDTLAFDFVKKIKQLEDNEYFQFSQFIAEYKLSLTTGTADSSMQANLLIKQVQHLFQGRRELIDAFNALIKTG